MDFEGFSTGRGGNPHQITSPASEDLCLSALSCQSVLGEDPKEMVEDAGVVFEQLVFH